MPRRRGGYYDDVEVTLEMSVGPYRTHEIDAVVTIFVDDEDFEIDSVEHMDRNGRPQSLYWMLEEPELYEDLRRVVRDRLDEEAEARYYDAAEYRMEELRERRLARTGT